MTIKASYKIEDPSNVDCTLTLTMKVRDWELLLHHIGSDWPGWRLRRMVRELIENARKNIYPPQTESTE